jgi:arsenate reductase (thioredoxin)
MTAPALNVLFLCTHNSARSILAEATLNHIARSRFRGFSAGSCPRENQRPNELAIEALRKAGISVEGLRSKTWDEFAACGVSSVLAGKPFDTSGRTGGGEGVYTEESDRVDRGEGDRVDMEDPCVSRKEAYGSGVEFDLIVTVCDNAASEVCPVCPVWPGHPATVHWGYADPSEVVGSEAEKREAFQQTLQAIRGRLELLVNLPDESLNRLTLARRARELATPGATSHAAAT